MARRGSAEKSECPWTQRLEGDQITVISYWATGAATQKHTNTLKALLQLNHLVFLEEMTEKHNSRKNKAETAFFVLRNKTDPLGDTVIMPMAGLAMRCEIHAYKFRN